MAATKMELVGRARELAPGIAARAEACEQLRAPHDDTIRELIDAELLELLVPRQWGGHELGLDAQIELPDVKYLQGDGHSMTLVSQENDENLS